MPSAAVIRICKFAAIREYGSDAFQVPTLQEWDDISNEALQAAETHFITEQNTFHNGYNI